MVEKQVVRQLIEKYFDSTLGDKDSEMLLRLLQDNEDLVIGVLDEMQIDAGAGAGTSDKERMKDSLRKVLSIDKVKETQVVAIFPRSKRRWWLVAASVIILLGTGTWAYQFFDKPVARTEAAVEPTTDVQAPVVSRATITLADGSTVNLDSLKSGEVARQGSIKIVKLTDGQIAYQTGSGDIIQENQYNTLSNPRGSRVIDMTLADGTRVWLNTESSITYPVVFAGNERRVEMTGEGYFEVAHDKKIPFNVSVDGMNVKVLGTHFNINAYSDEGVIRTTLIEGRVEVSNSGKSVTLKPGEQARFQISNSELQTLNNIDIDAVMAWKNGLFVFTGTNIQGVMRQLSKWYDVDVGYEGNVTKEEFVGVISRSRFDNISKILEKLERTRTVSFGVNGRHITVMPYKK